MNIEELKTKTEADISEYITKKLLSLRKDRERSYQYPVYCTGKMTGLESYDIKIDLI